MLRRITIAFLFSLAAAAALLAQSKNLDIYWIDVEGGGSTLIVTPEGQSLLVDTGNPTPDDRDAKREVEAAHLAGLKKIDYLLITHYHGDHVGGNATFANAGSTVIAQDNVRKRLESGGIGGNGGSFTFQNPPQAKAALPVITFDHDVTVHFNGEDIRALHFPAGHTDGDSIIFFPKSNVVHMGDDFVRYGFPFIDVNAGGSVQGMIAACEKVAAELPADVKVIPGHGAISNLNDLREFTEMLKGTTAVVEKALKAHETLDQMKQEKILAPWQKWSGDFVTSDVFLETIYNSLTGTKGSFVKHN